MRKIAIYTLYNSSNFGAFLQAFALYTKIEQLGMDPYFVIIDEKSEFQKIVSKRSIYNRLYNKIINYRRSIYTKRQISKYKPCVDRFHLINKKELKNEKIDSIVVGSDEVWDVTNKHFPHCLEFYGYNLGIDNIISYAPSSNRSKYEDFIAFKKDISFDNFTYISVRDQNTFDLVSKFTNKSIAKVLDPTFLIDSYDTILKKCCMNNFILIYGYTFSKEQIKEIKQFSKSVGMPLISIGLYQNWCDKNVVADPFEFLGYINAASYVITSTFHGSVFSIIFNKQFFTYVQDNNKVYDLLNQFNLLKRDVSTNNIFNVAKKDIDYEKVNEIKKIKVNSSMDYLKKALKK